MLLSDRPVLFNERNAQRCTPQSDNPCFYEPAGGLAGGVSAHDGHGEVGQAGDEGDVEPVGVMSISRGRGKLASASKFAGRLLERHRSVMRSIGWRADRHGFPFTDDGWVRVGVKLGVAILTMGTRPKELAQLLASVAMQTAPAARTVVVANGCELPELPSWVETVRLPDNRGVTGGRNAALEHLRDMDLVLDLDDDGLLVDDSVFATIAALFEADDKLGIVGFRIADETGATQRRHVPRLRAGDPMRAGEVTGFLGGAHVLSARMLDEIGGWPEEFFFAHEETDLAWRAIDAGWRVRYEPQLLLQHPRTSPARHALFYRVNARNRVYLARRHLPVPLVPVYLGVWVGLTLARTRSLSGLRTWFRGFAEGWRTPCGGRSPMHWRTVFALTRLGRPPVI